MYSSARSDHLPPLRDRRGHSMPMLERLIGGLIENGATFMALEDAAAEYAQRS